MLSTLEIDVPDKIKGNYLSRNMDFKPEIFTKDGRKIYKWTARNVYVDLVVESFLPPYNEIYSNLTFVAEKKWNEVAKWFYDLSQPQIEPSQEIRDFVKGVMERTGGDREKILRELYYFVSQNIRYVSIPLTYSDYQPHKVTDTYRNKYGDCKDKGALLISLYKLAGIEAHFALLRTRRSGPIIKEFPALELNHAIVAVKKQGGGYLFLDPTLELNRFGYVPAYLQDIDIFVVKKDGYEFVKLPLESENISGTDNETEMRVGDGYVITGNSKTEFYGESEVIARVGFKYSRQEALKAIFESVLKSMYTNPKLIDFSFSKPDDLNEKFWIKWSYEIRNQIKEVGNLLVLDLPTVAGNAAVSTEKRIYPLYFLMLEKRSTVLNIIIPPYCKVKNVPSSAKKDSPFASYRREVSTSDDKITIKTYSKSKILEIPVSQYEAYKKFVTDIEKLEKESIILEKVGQDDNASK